MNFAIIAAGEGKRLLNEGNVKPKPLVKINGEVMIKRLLDVFETNNASFVSIIVNESSIDVKNYINSLKYSFPIKIKIKSTPSSMHSLYEMRELIGDKTFCLTTVDTIFNIDEFKSFIKFSESQSDKDAVMAVTTFIDDEKPLFIKTNGDRIVAFCDEKSNNTYVSGGIYYFKPLIWEVLQKSIDSGIYMMRNFQRNLLKSGMKIGFYEFSKIIDVDHINDIKTAENFINANN